MSSIKQLLKANRLTGPAIKVVKSMRWKLRVWQENPTRHIRRVMGKKMNLQLIQIGSNDGVTDDPLYPLLLENPSWQILLVEPVPWLFDKLKSNYRQIRGASFVNAAIGGTYERRPFFYIEPSAKLVFPDLPNWFDQLGSFDSGHITRHFGNRLVDHIRKLQIEVIPIEALLNNHSITHFDVLHIDTEGADWEILKSVNLELYQPKIILFEFKHLSELERQEAAALLEKNYTLKQLIVSGDIFCVRKEK